jgi:hypothetical protein
MSSHTPSFLKSLLNFFVAKREKSGVALTGKGRLVISSERYKKNNHGLFVIF